MAKHKAVPEGEDGAMDGITRQEPDTQTVTLAEQPLEDQPKVVVAPVEPVAPVVVKKLAGDKVLMVRITDDYRWNTIQVGGSEFTRTARPVRPEDACYADVLVNPYLIIE